LGFDELQKESSKRDSFISPLSQQVVVLSLVAYDSNLIVNKTIDLSPYFSGSEFVQNYQKWLMPY
jgi:hypothetical protein